MCMYEYINRGLNVEHTYVSIYIHTCVYVPVRYIGTCAYIIYRCQVKFSLNTKFMSEKLRSTPYILFTTARFFGFVLLHIISGHASDQDEVFYQRERERRSKTLK